MTLYYRTTDQRVLDLDPAIVAGQAQSKRDILRLFIVDTQPAPSATQAVADGGIVVGPVEAHQTWALRAKTQSELDADADATDAATLKASAAITLLKAEIAGTSSLTAAQFRVLAARVLLFLVRRAIGGA
jgi:hypothetical protein